MEFYLQFSKHNKKTSWHGTWKSRSPDNKQNTNITIIVAIQLNNTNKIVNINVTNTVTVNLKHI